ncbi:MAG: hypothetical protein IJ007_09235 [Oscillospiraceae bacterium]|nr:hypothetical protein [Oscillospiraceae bacterium]
MEKKAFHEIFTVKNILIYVLKVFILFFILYFTVTTAAVLLFIVPVLAIAYVALYLGLTYFISRFPKSQAIEGQGFFKRYILMPLLLLIGVGFIFLGIITMNIAKDKLEIIEAHYFIDNAEEIIEYNTNNFYVSGIMETEYKHELILIDYDKMTVGFIHHPYASAELTKIKLQKNAPINSDMVQQVYELSSPGAEFTSFYPDEKSKHRTIAIQIEMADGTVYSADGLADEDGDTLYLGLG